MPPGAGLVEWNTLFLIARRQCAAGSRAFRLFNAAYWGEAGHAQRFRGGSGARKTLSGAVVPFELQGSRQLGTWPLAWRPSPAETRPASPSPAQPPLPTHTHLQHARTHGGTPPAVSFYPVRVLLFPALLPLFWREMQVSGLAGGAGEHASGFKLGLRSEDCGVGVCGCVWGGTGRGCTAEQPQASTVSAPYVSAPQNGYAWWEAAAVMTTQVGCCRHCAVLPALPAQALPVGGQRRRRALCGLARPVSAWHRAAPKGMLKPLQASLVVFNAWFLVSSWRRKR